MSRRSEIVAALDTIAALGGRIGTGATGQGEAPIPTGTALPYAVLYVDTDEAPVTKGDSRTTALDSTVQVSVFEREDDEDPTLGDAVRTALDGLRFTEAGTMRLRWDFSTRLVDEAADLVHRAHSLTLVRLT